MRLPRKVEVFARDLPQDHLLDSIQVDEVIVEGDPHALDERLGGVISE